jgi:hypothetical protein
MIWLFVYGALGIGLVLFAVFLFRGIRAHSTEGQRLSVSDYVAVAGAALNIALLIIAVGSLHVAITTYQDARRSGEDQTKALESSRNALAVVAQSLDKQGETLEKSRQALDASVTTAVAQQKLLSEGVANSRKQLGVLEAEWARELEQPDIHAVLVYPQSPAIIVQNASKVKPVRAGLYQIFLLNLDRPQGVRLSLVENVATPVDFIEPSGQFLPSSLNLVPAPGGPQPLKGDRLFGYLSIGCAECKAHRAYWVFMKYQEEGRYCEAKGVDYPFYKLTPENVENYVSEFLRRSDLVEMPRELK